MGLRYARIKFSELKERNANSNITANVSIVPAIDICIYTPYLISIDLCRAIAEIGRTTDNIFINLDNECFPRTYPTLENLLQLSQKAEEKTKLLEKKPSIWFKYQDTLFKKDSFN
jgi:hypothetical protein